jgi:hypothetical protein
MVSQDTNRQNEGAEDKQTQPPSSKDAYELGKDLFGRYSSGSPDRQRQRGELIRRKIREKHAR